MTNDRFQALDCPDLAKKAREGGAMSAPNRETRSERVLTRACQHCGETFEPTRPHQKFCRPSCRRAAFTKRDQQPRLPVGDPEDLFCVPSE